jgi:Cu+-exporting ATPase
MLTGEPLPVSKRAGRQADRRHAEHQRGAGDALRRVGAQTMLSQIVQMVAQAQRSKAPMQRMADQVAGWFVMAVVASRC